MEPMTYEKAKEIINKYPNGWIADVEFDFSSGFLEGWDARGKEVDELRSIIITLKGDIDHLEKMLKLANSK